MNRTAVVAGFAVGLALFAAVAAGGTAATTQADAGGNVSFGAEVSSFMQASSAETEGEVGDEMFAAAMNRTDDPEERRRLIEQRRAALAERQQRLQRRQERLGSASPLERQAIATEIAVGAVELEQSINRTERAAAAAGMNTSALVELRNNASEMRGMAVAEMAGGIGAPSAGGGGPPDDAPGASRGNGSASDQRPDDPGNGSEADPEGNDGKPDDPGNDDGAAGNDSGSEGNDDSPGQSGDGGSEGNDDPPGQSGDGGSEGNDDPPGQSGDDGGNSGGAGNGGGNSGGASNGGPP